MATEFALSLAEDINNQLTPKAVLDTIGFHADKIQETETTIKAFCPIHQDSRFRSLLVEKDRPTFRCTIKTCPGFEGGTLLHLYAFSKNTSLLAAAFELATGLPLELDSDWKTQLAQSYLDDANRAREEGDLTQAETLLQALISIMPDLIGARTQLAAIQMDLGNPEAAAQEYSNLIEHLISTNQLGKADSVTASALTLFPDNEDILFFRVKLAEESGDQDLIIARTEEIIRRREAAGRDLDNVGLIEQLVDKAPERTEFALKLALLYELQRNLRGASRQYENAARVLLAQGKRVDAVELFEKVVQFNGENIRARLELAGELKTLGNMDDARAHTFRAVNQQIDQQDFHSAEKTIQAWIENENDNIEAREFLARIYLEQERVSEAAAYLSEGALIAEAAGNYEQSSDLLLRAKFLTPDDPVLRRRLVQAFEATKELQRAAFEKVDLAEILFTSGENSEAEQLLQSGVTQEISLPLKLQMVRALANHNCKTSAIEALHGVARDVTDTAPSTEQVDLYELLTRLEPTVIVHHQQYINHLYNTSPVHAAEAAGESISVLLSHELNEGAESILEIVATRLDGYVPGVPRLLELCERCQRIDYLGAIYQASIQGFAECDAESALKAAKRMSVLDPNHASAPFDIGYLLATLDRKEEAAEQYAQISSMLYQAGDHENALQYAQEGLSLNPDSINALALMAKASHRVLTAEEAEAHLTSLLVASRKSRDAQSVTTGYLTYIDLRPDDDKIFTEAAQLLAELNAVEGSAHILSRQASKLSGTGEWEAACGILKKAHQSAPEIGYIAEQYGESCNLAGSKDEAAIAYAHAALVFAHQDDMDSAIRCTDSGLQCKADSIEALEALFKATERVGRLQVAGEIARNLLQQFRTEGTASSAVRWAREWVRLTPDLPEAHESLGSVLSEGEQIENGLQSLSIATELFINENRTSDALDVLKKIASLTALTSHHRQMLSAILAMQISPDIHREASMILGQTLIDSNELDKARTVASDLATGLSHTFAAQLYTKIARQESIPRLAVLDYINAAHASSQAGDTDSAINVLKLALATDSSNHEVHKLIADLLHKQGRYEEALPHQIVVLEKLANENGAELSAAISEFRSTYHENVDGLYKLAKLLNASGRGDEAVQDLEAAATIAHSTDNITALISICTLDDKLTRQSLVLTRFRADALMGMENEQQALDWVRSSGRELLAAGKPADALDMANRWLSLSPRDIDGNRLLAEASSALGKSEDAYNARLKIAQIRFDNNDINDASAEIDSVLNETPGFIPALELKIKILNKSHQPEMAADNLHLLANALVLEGRTEEATRIYQDVLAIRPNDETALWNLAEILREMQGNNAALPVYRQWLTVQKIVQSPQSYIDAIKAVITFAPDSVPLLRELTAALLGTGSSAEAEGYIITLAAKLESEGDYQGAAQSLELNLRQGSPEQPLKHVTIAQLYEKCNDFAQAQDHLRTASSLLSAQGKAAEAIPFMLQVIKLSGDAALPEDYAVLADLESSAGKLEDSSRTMRTAIQLLQRTSGNSHRRETLLTKALEIEPLNVDYVLQHMALLSPGRAMTEGLRKSHEMTMAGFHDGAIQVITKLISLAPHDMSLRQELFKPLRKSGNHLRLSQELLALASDAIAAGDMDAAVEALDEAKDLVASAAQHRDLGELNERARRLDIAAEQFTRASLAYSEEGKIEQAIASINRGISIKPSAVSADTMSTLIQRIGEPIYEIAREQLRSELTARRQKQSHTLALTLLDISTGDRQNELLKTVNLLGGSTFLVGIVRHRVHQLLDQKDIIGALQLATSLISISPDSPDAWFLTGEVHYQADQIEDARRCAMEAARLFQIAGAVIEEEDAYRLALKAEPDNSEVKDALSDYLIREHRPEEAIDILQENLLKAEAAGDTDVLIECLGKALTVAPANTDLREKLATTLEPIAPDSAIENWLEVAQSYAGTGEVDRSRRVYEHILQLHPSNEAAQQALLSIFLETGDLPGAARLTRSLSDLKASRKDVGEAVRLLQRYLEIDPDNLDVLERLSALAGKSNNSEVFYATTRALAQRLEKLGKHEQALNQYELLLERKPRDIRLLTTLIDCSAAAGMPERGAAFAHQLLAVAKETEDPERIRIAAGSILSYDPENASAHNDLGEALLSLNRVPEAVAEWLRAGETYESTGNTANAYMCYRRITQINPATLQAWKRMADVAITINDYDTAKNAVFHILNKSPDLTDPKISVLLNRLLSAMPEDYQVHGSALDFYRKTDNQEQATIEYLWLINQAISENHIDQADQLVHDALTWMPGQPELKKTQHQIIRRMGRLEELQVRLRHEAEVFETSGRLQDAAGIFAELVDLAPDQITLRREYVRLLKLNEDADQAFVQNLEIIRLLLERSELEEARDMADSLAKAHAKDFEAREKIADLLASSAFPDVAARHYLAAAKMAQSKKLKAHTIELLRKAVLARPTWPETRKALAEAYERADDSEEAFNAWIELTTTLVDAGEYLEATATLDRLAVERPDSPEVREQLANLYERTGNRSDQATILNELIALYEERNNQAALLATYRKLISIQPDDPTLLSRYVDVMSSSQDTPDGLSDEYTKLADIHAKNGDYDAAFQTYEQVLGISPDNTTARSRYAQFLLHRGSRNKALSEMRILASLYTDRSDHSAAVEVLNAALAISPRDADLCLTLAKAQEAAGMHEDARLSYSRATAILASTAAVKGIDTYRRILSQDEKNTAVRLRLVETLLNSGDKIEAAREARILAEIHLEKDELQQAENAFRYVDMCEPESIDEVRAAISRDSYNPSLQYIHYVRLGNQLMQRGDIDSALDIYRTARSLNDDQPEIIQKCIDCVSLIAPEAEAIPDYLLMAEKLLTRGDFAEARKAYDQVRLIDPFNNDARGGLETVNVAEKSKMDHKAKEDDLVLKAGRPASKRVVLMDLLVACQEAAHDKSDEQSLR